MKSRITLAVLALLLLNSCIVKSLFPFFTAETVRFEKALLGNWTDSNNNVWEITSLRDKIKADNNNDLVNFYEDMDELNSYHDGYSEGYYIKTQDKGRTAAYIAVAFELDGQLFIDFSPVTFELDQEHIPSLTSYHLVSAHSLVKVDITDNKLSMRWLDSDKLEKLLDEKRIKIQHTKTFDFPSYLLTASSEELQKFIRKYMASNEDRKWSTDVKFDLIRTDDQH